MAAAEMAKGDVAAAGAAASVQPASAAATHTADHSADATPAATARPLACAMQLSFFPSAADAGSWESIICTALTAGAPGFERILKAHACDAVWSLERTALKVAVPGMVTAAWPAVAG